MSLSGTRAYTPGWRLGSLAPAALFLYLVAAPAAALETIAKQAILMDAQTGTVLLEKNADDTMPPSSMSKLMTVYMVFERLKNGSLTLDDKLPVSKKAWRKGGSKMYVLVGKSVRVEDLLRGIIVQSGNDATIVVAEGLSGTEEAFATEMTKKGREIGLENSVFRNASGWPEEGHYMTARDIALLSKRTIDDFPDYYHYYAETSFTFSGIRQGNRNPLIYRNMGADGLKTGHTEAGGFGLAASVIRDGRRLILVVNGIENAQSRANESQRLIEWGFREFANFALFRAGETVDEANVWLGTEAKVPLILEQDLVLTLPKRARRTAKVKVVYTAPIPAPITDGAEIAKLVITAPGLDDLVVPLMAGAEVRRLGFLGRISAAIQYLLWGRQR
ncbi:MAG: D-alanyl-D-alanine carboxypeptidase [Proteobacteria bacterium]|nr:D-alanyl-D-alanine carboxypeptidase [Pseudomonadota bacterium]